MSPQMQAFVEQEQQRMLFQQWIRCSPHHSRHSRLFKIQELVVYVVLCRWECLACLRPSLFASGGFCQTVASQLEAIRLCSPLKVSKLSPSCALQSSCQRVL